MHNFILSFIVTRRCCNAVALNHIKDASQNLFQKLLMQNLTIRKKRSLALVVHSSRLLRFYSFLDAANDDVGSCCNRDANNKYRGTMQKHLDERVPDVIRGGSGSSERKGPEIIRRIERSQCLRGTPGTGTCCEPARVRARARKPSSRYFLTSVQRWYSNF